MEDTITTDETEVTQEAEETTSNSVDPDELADRIANRLQPKEEEARMEDLTFDEQVDRLKSNSDTLSERLQRVEAKEWAMDHIDTVKGAIPDEYRNSISESDNRKITNYLADLAVANPGQFTKGIPETVKKQVAALVLGEAMLSGKKGPSPSVKGEAGNDNGIPNYNDIVKGYKELHGKEPSLDEVKRLSKHFIRSNA